MPPLLIMGYLMLDGLTDCGSLDEGIFKDECFNFKNEVISVFLIMSPITVLIVNLGVSTWMIKMEELSKRE